MVLTSLLCIQIWMVTHAMVLTDADGNPLADITGVTWDNALIADPDGGSQPLVTFVDVREEPTWEVTDNPAVVLNDGTNDYLVRSIDGTHLLLCAYRYGW